MSLTAGQIKEIIGYGLILWEKYGPMIEEYFKEKGQMPSIAEIEAMHKIGKDPKDYFRKKTL